MSKPKLTVIEGGLSTSGSNTHKEFAGAYITNTRLMGVMGMYVHWKLTEYPACPDFHQFFYFDAEEYGFESYRSVTGNKVEEIASIEQTMINGLGGRKMELSEREVRAILWKYMLFNKEHNIPLPEKLHEYEFLLEEEVLLDTGEYSDLVMKLCDPIASPFHVINYFLMRCFGHDYEAASWLCRSDVPLHLYRDEHPQATFCKNTIDFDDSISTDARGCNLRPIGDRDTESAEAHPGSKGNSSKCRGGSSTRRVASRNDADSAAYLCESLVEYDGQYHIVISRVTVDGELMVTGFEACSSFKISSMEAAMMLAKPEFITVYETLIPVDEFSSLLSQVPINCLITPHQNGKLYMMFHNHNDHVNKQIFMLSADVAGIYYLSNSGQLLAVAYGLPEIHALEKDLRKSVLSPYAVATGKYEFKEPVLYDFVESQFEDFNEFLEFIQA